MSEPVRPRELWGLWSEAKHDWLYIFAGVKWSMACFKHDTDAITYLKANESRCLGYIPARLESRIASAYDAQPEPASAPSPPLECVGITSATGELVMSVKALDVLALLRQAGYLVLSPEELKERTGQ